jgi:hypothetical protein
MKLYNEILLFQQKWTTSFKNFCEAMKTINIDPNAFFNSFENNELIEYSDEFSDDQLSFFAKKFFQLVLDDVLKDRDTYKIYFNENGSAKMLQKQYDLMWPKDEETSEKQIKAFYEFSIAMQYFLFEEETSKQDYFLQMQNNEEAVKDLLQNVSNSLTNLIFCVFKNFINKHVK